MDRNSYTQLDLFSQSKEGAGYYEHGHNGSVSRWLKGYELIILTICAIIITGIIAFSFGVENGKRNTRAVLPTAKVSIPETAIKKQTVKTEVKPGLVTESLNRNQYQTTILKEETSAYKEFKESLQKYTIQVASFSSKAYAQQEADSLKKKGVSAMLKPQGKYIALCVGNFSDKEAARGTLSQLKKQYSGCYIRRL